MAQPTPLTMYRGCRQHHMLLDDDGTCGHCVAEGKPGVLDATKYFLVQLEAPFKVWLQGVMVRATQ